MYEGLALASVLITLAFIGTLSLIFSIKNDLKEHTDYLSGRNKAAISSLKEDMEEIVECNNCGLLLKKTSAIKTNMDSWGDGEHFCENCAKVSLKK